MASAEVFLVKGEVYGKDSMCALRLIQSMAIHGFELTYTGFNTIDNFTIKLYNN